MSGQQTTENQSIVNRENAVPAVDLRDYFAAAALQGILARGQSLSSKKDEVLEAFKYSDAMLKAREAKP